ncbi:MAG: carbon-nitrogen hydrolase family protein [Nitrospinae bacterium]|nr:carbon-nitrogen hydrolase family protein [Nitrospinota bacterium]
MSRKVIISTVQLPTPSYPRNVSVKMIREENLKAACSWLEVAGKRMSDIVSLGETFTTIGCPSSKYTFQELGEAVHGQVLTDCSKIARRYKMYIIAPILELCEGKLRNVALVIDRKGRLIGQYYKVHCTRGERENGIVPGDEFKVFSMDFGKIGIMICHDNSFPESARVLALKGAEVIFWPHVQGGWGEVAWEAVLRSRAIDNSVYLVSSAYGVPDNKAWRPGMIQGRSGIIAPDGLIIVEMGRRIGVATVEVDLDKPRIANDFTMEGEHEFKKDMLMDRRPDTYRVIIERKN